MKHEIIASLRPIFQPEALNLVVDITKALAVYTGVRGIAWIVKHRSQIVEAWEIADAYIQTARFNSLYRKILKADPLYLQSMLEFDRQELDSQRTFM